MPTEFVLQPPVVRIRYGTVAEMIGRLSSQPLGLGGKVRRLSSVICLPELHRFSEQAAQTMPKLRPLPLLVWTTSLIERSTWARHFCCFTPDRA